MAATAAHLEKAYGKLIRWCSSEFRSMGRDASLEVPDELSEATRRLRLRPELLACATSPITSPTLTKLPPTFPAKCSPCLRRRAKPLPSPPS